MQHLACRTDRASPLCLCMLTSAAGLLTSVVLETGSSSFALLPQNFQWHSPSCFMFLASVVEPGVGAFDWQNLCLRPVPIAAERLEIQVCNFFYPLKRGWALLLTRPYKLVDSVVMKMIFRNWAAKNNDTYILWLVYLYFWASWSTAKQFFIQTFYFIWRKILVVQQWAAVGTSKQNPWSGRNLCYLV